MSVNHWDYLMGDKMSAGHEASTYTLEDWTELINEYDRYLAPYLSLREPFDPLDSREPNAMSQSVLAQTIATLNETVQELRQQLSLVKNS